MNCVSRRFRRSAPSVVREVAVLTLLNAVLGGTLGLLGGGDARNALVVVVLRRGTLLGLLTL